MKESLSFLLFLANAWLALVMTGASSRMRICWVRSAQFSGRPAGMTRKNRWNSARRFIRDQRRGSMLVLSALLLVALAGMLAFSIDLGYMYTVQGQLDRSVDAAALAAAAELHDGVDSAYDQAVEYLVRNPVGNAKTVAGNDGFEALKVQWLEQHQDELEISTGVWNPITRTLDPASNSNPPSAIEVSLNHTNMPLFFGRILGRETFSVHSSAVASFRPRDIVVVIDLSASMNNDSEFKSISRLGRPAIEANLNDIWQDLGSPIYGDLEFEPKYISSRRTSTVKEKLGLDGVPYPYPSGSWDQYIQYVQSDYYIRRAGYKKRYGMMTLVNYWLYAQPMYEQTPDLWMTRCQPLQSVKDAVDVFLDYMDQNTTHDKVGLAIYNSANGLGSLEVELSEDTNVIRNQTASKQAGHYHGWTNIGGGLKSARQHLEAEGRPNALKMVVLVTDGVTNWTAGGYNPAAAQSELSDEANYCKELGFPVFTISLGSAADNNAMNDVAQITGGIHFNVPGGQNVAQYRQQLIDAFREIAGHRPLKLVSHNFDK